MKKGFTHVMLVILLLAVSTAFAYYYGTQQKKLETETPVVETAQQDQLPAEQNTTPSPSSTPTTNVPIGWETYTNQQYGFEISYPSNYRTMTDANNLYGYPNGIVLFYGGGQSYDLVVEHWNLQTDYESKYRNQTNVTVKKVGDIYITLFNANFEPEVDNIIETFRAI